MDAQGVAISGDGGWTNPRWHYPEYPAGSVVEIRVHGVGGEAPSGMTRDPHPRNVGGDSLAGLWRARNPVVGELGDRRLHVREVLAWGGQTSGTFRHAFWVLLLPFALFNVAGRMHPAKATGARARAHRAVARLLAYTMTLSVIALTSAVAFDLLGVQYVPPPTDPAVADPAALGAAADAPTGAWVLAPLRFFHEPAAKLGFLALLPIVVLIVLWLAGKYRTRDLEGYDADAVVGGGGEPVALDNANFWRNEWSTSRLRATHATGGIALVGATLTLALADIGPSTQEDHWAAAFAIAAAVVVVGAIVATLPATATPGPSPALNHVQWLSRLAAMAVLVSSVVIAVGDHIPDPPTLLAWILRLAGVATVAWWLVPEAKQAGVARPNTKITRNLFLLAGIAAVVATFPSTSAHLVRGNVDLGDLVNDPTVLSLPSSMAWVPDTITDWLGALTPGLYAPAYALLLPLTTLQIALVLCLLLTGVQRTRPARPGANPGGSGFPLNLGGVVTALLALLIITSVGASVHALAIEWLDERRLPGSTTGLVLPWWYGVTAVVGAFVVPLLLGVAFVVRLVLRGRGALAAPAPTPADVAADLNRGLGGPVAATPATEKRLQSLGKGWLTQRLLRDAGHILSGGVALATLTVIAYFAVIAFDDDVAASQELPLTSAAVWVVTGLVGLSIGLIRSSLKDRGQQRRVGVLWDVLSFWPRVTHPFAPPCYGEAVVPMLTHRIRGLAERDYGVVLAGHSQGTIVSLAAMTTATTPHVHLVTYGSPVTILYERFFPGVFGGPAGAIVKGEAGVATWHHLFGMTEPFAMPFWAIPGATADDLRRGWAGNGLVPHAADTCPVCGWCGTGPATSPAAGAPTRTDFVVSDPSRWQPPLDPVDPVPKGHSTYHDNREVDDHLAHIAAGAAR